MPYEKPTKKTVLGSLAGSAATRVAIKPYSFVWPRDDDKFGEYVEWTQKIVNELHSALKEDDEFMARALVDHGGPYWSKTYLDFWALSEEDRIWVLRRLEPAAMTACRALVECAEDESWSAMLSEGIDATSWLMGDHKGKPRRPDVLVRRPARGDVEPRLIIDLKYHERFRRADIQSDLDAIVAAYGVTYAKASGNSVVCCILAYNETGEVRWSREALVPRDVDEKSA